MEKNIGCILERKIFIFEKEIYQINIRSTSLGFAINFIAIHFPDSFGLFEPLRS